jgi:hypothetical protein
VVFLPAADGMLLASAFARTDPARAKMLAGLRGHPISLLLLDGMDRCRASACSRHLIVGWVHVAGPLTHIGIRETSD